MRFGSAEAPASDVPRLMKAAALSAIPLRLLKVDMANALALRAKRVCMHTTLIFSIAQRGMRPFDSRQWPEDGRQPHRVELLEV